MAEARSAGKRTDAVVHALQHIGNLGDCLGGLLATWSTRSLGCLLGPNEFQAQVAHSDLENVDGVVEVDVVNLGRDEKRTVGCGVA
jgi:hypothetical protein